MNNFIIENNHFKLLQRTQIIHPCYGEKSEENNELKTILISFHYTFKHLPSWMKVFHPFQVRKRRKKKSNLIQNHKPKFKIKTIEKFFFPSFANFAVCRTCGKFSNNFNFLLWLNSYTMASPLFSISTERKKKNFF